MPSMYLNDNDKALYGAPNATTSQISIASTLIDGYLQRPEGLQWSPDANGNPCYMTNTTPSIVLTATENIAAGKNVNITVTGGLSSIGLGSPQSGIVAILDRANPTLTEACIVIGWTGNTIQLSNVQFNHLNGCLLEFGMVIFEEKKMPAGRPVTNVTKTPVRVVLAGQGRYGYARRGASYFEINEYNLLAAITKFGGPPIWEIFDQTKIGINPNTGELWAPAGILLAYYTEIRFSYIAGWNYASLPYAVKVATANIINAADYLPLNGAISRNQAGDTAIQRFGATYFDDDTKAMLEPFKSRQFA